MRMPNTAIIRERLPMPTTDELIHKLNGAKVFSKPDLRHRYHQILLAPESRYITTFRTHKGLHRYVRLTVTMAHQQPQKFSSMLSAKPLLALTELSTSVTIYSYSVKHRLIMTQPLKLYLNDCDKSASPSTNRNVLITRVHWSSLV
jgi:hypothetical protein